MASAALDWDALWVARGPAVEPVERRLHVANDLRADEDAVRILLVEERPQLARMVCWALQRAERGYFEVEQAAAIDHARGLLDDVVGALFDAILVDLGDRAGERAHDTIDAAEALAHQVPVIVLTGTRFDDGLAPVRHDDEVAAFVAREHVACERLPATILEAIRRHRRVGQGGAHPVIYRMHD